MFRVFIAQCLLSQIFFVVFTKTEISDSCIDCLAKVEMGTSGKCVMDQGSPSCGVFQLKKVYWLDCGQLGSSWQECAADETCARNCIKGYMKRYEYICKKQLTKDTLSCIDYGRIHNGGPNGCPAHWTRHYVDLMKKKCVPELSHYRKPAANLSKPHERNRNQPLRRQPTNEYRNNYRNLGRTAARDLRTHYKQMAKHRQRLGRSSYNKLTQ